MRSGFLSHPAPATAVLVIANVRDLPGDVYQGAGPNLPGGELFNSWFLQGLRSAAGDWYRLVTSMFLHGSLIHLAFNMLALWWLGSVVEQALGPGASCSSTSSRGWPGRRALAPEQPVRSRPSAPQAAIYGILGALLILEWLRDRLARRVAGDDADRAQPGALVRDPRDLDRRPPRRPGRRHRGDMGTRADTLRAEPADRPDLVVLIGVLSVAVAYVRVENYPPPPPPRSAREWLGTAGGGEGRSSVRREHTAIG